MDLSIVIPAYNEEKNVVILYEELKKVLDGLDKEYEIIFVDDGGTDRTAANLEKVHQKDNNVKAIIFQRNFGKAHALSAGLKEAQGELIITMDADLQDDPKEIPKFLEKIDEGYDLVVGWKYKRKDPFVKILLSKFFNFIVRGLTGIKLHDCDNNFRVMKKGIVEHLNLYGGMFRYIPVFAFRKGYKTTEVKVEHNKRRFGKTKYGFERVYNGFFDLITMKYLISFIEHPSYLFGGAGLLSFIIGLFFGLYLIYVKYFLNQLIGNRPLIFLTVLLIVVGLQFMFFGLIAEMLTYMNQRQRVRYVIKKILK